jgi:hypothetical protein
MLFLFLRIAEGPPKKAIKVKKAPFSPYFVLKKNRDSTDNMSEVHHTDLTRIPDRLV